MTDRIQLRFDDPAVFREEYARNIVKGGAFVPTSQRFEPRAVVTVEVELSWCNQRLHFDAEIVHCTPQGTDPRHAGVAVQFLVPVAEVRERLEPFTEAAAELDAAAAVEPDAVSMEAPPELAPAEDLLEEVDLAEEMGASEEAIAFESDAALGEQIDEILEADGAAGAAAPAGAALDASGEGGAPEPQIELTLEEPPVVETDELTLEEPPVVETDELTLEEPPVIETDELTLEEPPVVETDELTLEEPPVVETDELTLEEPPVVDSDELTLEEPLDAQADAAETAPARSGPPEPELVLDEGAAVSEALPPAADADAETQRGAGRSDAPPPDWSERRRSPRASARVPVHVESSHISLDGRTRDLSETGVLLSADASDLPLGKKVQLSLTHPATGERLMIDGTVARHVEAEGTIAAVGIEFDARLDDDDHLSSFINDVKAADKNRRETGINGVIEELGIVNLLQMFGKSSRQGTFTASCGAEEGVVAFENGNVRYVRLGSLRGTKALARMLSWEYGVFEFASHVDPLPQEDEMAPVEGAILEAVRQMDEAARLEGDAIQPTQRLGLNRDALATSTGELGQIEEAVLDLAAAGLTVRRLLDVIPEPDARILEALASLRQRGIISLAD